MNNLGNKETMAENIQYYLDLHHKDRSDLCRDLGFKYTTVSNWLQGVKYPRIDKIELMARYFGISKADLVEKRSEGGQPKDETAASSSSSPPLSKDDQALLHAFHNASDEAKRMVHFALRDSWPSDDEALEYVPGKGLAKATKKAASKALSEGKTVVIPAKINNKPVKVPDGVKVTQTRHHLKLTPTLSYHCKAVFHNIESEAYDDEDIKKALETYRKTLLDKKVATFISDTMDTIEARYGTIDESRAYTIIAEEVMGDDFMERYVAFGGAGVEKLIRRIKNRFR